MATKVKDAITTHINGGLSSIKNPDRKQNVGPAIFSVFYWQEVSSLADKQLKQAWEGLAEEGLIKGDDDLRKLAAGEHIALESATFSCLIKLSAPRKTLNEELFLEKASRKARISKEALEELWDECQTEGKPALGKKILEV